MPKYPPARPRRDAPQRPNALTYVRFAPKATEVLRSASQFARPGPLKSMKATVPTGVENSYFS